MQAYIVSDLHLGSSETRHQDFTRFIDTLPAGATLILNGDITNDATKRQICESEGAALVARLCRESFQRPILWLGGNNDPNYRPQEPNRIEFKDHHAFGKNLYICHGHRFLCFPRGTKWVQTFLGSLCGIFRRHTARTRHMADILQGIPPLYRLACHIVAQRATRFARRHGYAAIACGHTHHAEERMLNGIRYFNTGAWTEDMPGCLQCKEGALTLRVFANALDRQPCAAIQFASTLPHDRHMS